MVYKGVSQSGRPPQMSLQCGATAEFRSDVLPERFLRSVTVFLFFPSSHADIAVASLAFEILRTVGHEKIKATRSNITPQT